MRNMLQISQNEWIHTDRIMEVVAGNNRVTLHITLTYDLRKTAPWYFNRGTVEYDNVVAWLKAAGFSNAYRTLSTEGEK